MRAGRLEQLGLPGEVYARPQTPFVAEFVGLSNKLEAQVHDGLAVVLGVPLPLVDPSVPDGPALALVRPEAFSLAGHSAAEAGPLDGTVISTTFLGAVSRVRVDLGGGVMVLAQLSTGEAGDYPAGSRVRLALRRDPVLVSRSVDGAAE
jgi:putative spermidine/putrescine transport system ATP-binding protein